jgi:hypothetical protein
MVGVIPSEYHADGFLSTERETGVQITKRFIRNERYRILIEGSFYADIEEKKRYI